MALRAFQSDVQQRGFEALRNLSYERPGERLHIVEVMPTGGGKTVLTASNVSLLDAPQLVMAHRQELVAQQSLALARWGVRHDVIADPSTVSAIRRYQMDEIGANFIDQRSHVRVAGVDTVLARRTDPWFARVGYVHCDEAHHVLKHNKWGRTILEVTPHAHSIGYTATPGRADGQGLGADFDGIFHAMVEGPRPRDLINWGYLTDYRYIAEEPPPDLDLSQISLAADGDFNRKKLSKAVHESKRLVGDVVKAYVRWAPNKLGITFTTDVEEAVKIAAAFRQHGVSAEVVHGKTPEGLRRDLLARFRRREILMLVNVDLFGEGFDVPACEVVILARPTKSFPLYAQQCGRVLRVMVDGSIYRRWGDYTDDERLAFIAASTKPNGIIIDMVNNWREHSMPDNLRRRWSLERRISKREKDNLIVEMTRCTNPACCRAYERFLKACPCCNTAPEITPAQRRSVEQVAGDVAELSPEALAVLRGQVDANLAPPKYPFGANEIVRRGILNRHMEKTQELKRLEFAMQLWGAGQSALAPRPLSDAEQARAFYLTFGVDVLSAQALNRADAQALRERVERAMAVDNIVLADNNSANHGEKHYANHV